MRQDRGKSKDGIYDRYNECGAAFGKIQQLTVKNGIWNWECSVFNRGEMRQQAACFAYGRLLP